MSDTPRTDDYARSKPSPERWEWIAKCAEVETDLTAANERIKRLEDRIHRASMAFFRDGSDGHVASQMLAILEEERNKP